MSGDTPTGGGHGHPAPPDVQRAVVRYAGGLAARYRWTGSGGIAGITALSEVGGTLTDLGTLVSSEPDRLCRAELRVEGPLGSWTVRLASVISDTPDGMLWDTQGLLLVRYGFRLYALESRTGVLRWSHDSGTPLVAVLGSSRLEHVILQTEIETLALDGAGVVVWRVAQSDVVTAAELVGGRLVLTSWGGSLLALDPQTGREAVG